MGTGQILKEVYIKKVEETTEQIRQLDDYTPIDVFFIQEVLMDSIKFYYER